MVTIFDPSQTPTVQTNILDNGGFEIWQRGTTFTNPANSAYTADRWKLSNGGGYTFTITQESSTVDSGQYSMKVNITSASANAFQIYQVIENYQAYLGKTVTLSMRVWSNTAGPVIALSDNLTNTLSSAHPGDSQWHTLTVTKALSASMTSFQAFFQVAAGEGAVVSTTYWDSAMLVIGTAPAAFLPMNPQVDLARCQRFYEFSSPIHEQINPIQRNISTNISSYWTIPFKVTKRVNPTITFSNQSVSMYTIAGIGNSAVGNDTANWTFGPNPNGLSSFYVGASRTGGDQTTYQIVSFEFNWFASADF